MGISTGLVILGSVTLFVFFGFFWIMSLVGIKLTDDFISQMMPYFLIIGLLALPSGIGIKVYHWKKSSN